MLRGRDTRWRAEEKDKPEPGPQQWAAEALVRRARKESLVGAESCVTSCGLGIFMDHPAEPVPTSATCGLGQTSHTLQSRARNQAWRRDPGD